MQRFLQRDHDIGFDIMAAFRHGIALSEPSEGRSPAATTEKGFKEITETGAAKFKFDTAVLTAPPAKTAWLSATPLRRGLKSAGLIPMLTQLIVFPAFLRVA